MRDISDAELGRIMAMGLFVGVPFLFLVSMLVCVAAGISLGLAALIALVPTFFGGWFWAGMLFLMRATDRPDEVAPATQKGHDERETRPTQHAA